MNLKGNWEDGGIGSSSGIVLKDRGIQTSAYYWEQGVSPMPHQHSTIQYEGGVRV